MDQSRSVESVMVQTFHILGSLILQARLPINKTEGGTVWSLISRLCGQKAWGGLLFAQFLPNSLKKLSPLPPVQIAWHVHPDI